jgi:hypothetical protein
MRCARPSTIAVLPTPGLADQHRVVLGPALQHLDGAADLVVAADHRVELAGAGALGQVEGVLLQRLALALGLGAVDLLAAADRLDRRLHRRTGDAVLLQQGADRAFRVGRREDEHLAGDELVAALVGFPFGRLQQVGQVASGLHRLAALHLRQLGDLGVERGLQPGDVGPGAREQGLRPVGLGQKRRQQVRRLDVRIAPVDGQALGVGEGGLEGGGELVESHGTSPDAINLRQTGVFFKPAWASAARTRPNSRRLAPEQRRSQAKSEGSEGQCPDDVGQRVPQGQKPFAAQHQDQ